MRDFPSCFGENGVQVSDSSSSSTTKAGQNLVTCVYQSRLRGCSCLITVTWTKTLIGQGLSISIDDSANHCLCKVDIKPWLFSKRKGSKKLEVEDSKIDVYWDFASARFGSGPEPLESFYLAIVFNGEIVLLVGDLKKEARKKIDGNPNPSKSAIFIAKKEHVFGKKNYSAKLQFGSEARVHDVLIECETVKDPSLVIRIDGKEVMQAKRLRWKFRGNYTMLVDGVQVEVFWDVHNWLFGNGLGNAVFMFQTCLSAEKLWSGVSESVFDRCCSRELREGLGFSLILYAWKSE